MDCNTSCTPVTSCISRCPATNHLEHHPPHAELLLHLFLVLANPTSLHDGFHSPPGVHPSCGCSFDSFASCGQASGGEILPTHSFPWRYPMAEAQQARAVSSRPPGLRARALISKRPNRSPRWVFLRSTAHHGKPWKEKCPGWPPAAKCHSFWSPGGMTCMVQSTSSPEHPSDTCFAKFCVRKCTFSHTVGPVSH